MIATAALVLLLIVPTTLLFARQADDLGLPVDQEVQVDGADAAAEVPSYAEAASDETEASPTLPGQQGLPASDPGPVVTPTPTAPPLPSPTPPPVATATPTATPTPRSLTMRVIVDVYSGRPNPTWEISAEEATRLVTIFRQLPDRELSTLPDSLGYRGMVLEGDAVRALGYERITTRRGVAVAEGARGTKAFWDRDHELEAQAAATGQGRVDLSSLSELLPTPTPVPRDFRPPQRPFER